MNQNYSRPHDGRLFSNEELFDRGYFVGMEPLTFRYIAINRLTGERKFIEDLERDLLMIDIEKGTEFEPRNA